MDLLAKRGVDTLIVEGDSHVLYSYHEAALVDRIITKHIPVIAGSADNPTHLEQCVSRPLNLSRWKLAECFITRGVAVTLYEVSRP